MKILHLINKKEENSFRRLGLTKVKDQEDVYTSCCWDFKKIEADMLVGGKIYFHDAKSELSFFGGTVIRVDEMSMSDGPTEYYHPSPGDEKKRQNRLMFTLRAELEAKGVAWAGKNHSMSWTSGIIDQG